MTEPTQEIKKQVLKRIYVDGKPAGLYEITEQNGGDPKLAEKANSVAVACIDPERVSNRFITIPVCNCYSDDELKREQSGKAKLILEVDPLRVYSQPIRPKIAEIFRLFADFENQTKLYLKEFQNKLKEKKLWPMPPGCQFITHLECWDEKFDPNSLGAGSDSSPYLDYRIETYIKFTDSMRKMGMFVRDMTYLFHYCFNRQYFKVVDNEQMKNALIFTDKFFTILLERLDMYLFALSHYYQSVNGSYHDVSAYHQAHLLIEATFGELLKYFSRQGGITHFTNYPGYFFVVSEDILKKHSPFVDGVDGEKLNEQFIFDNSQDYASLASNSKLSEIAQTLDKNLNEFVKNSYQVVPDTNKKSQQLFIHHNAQKLNDLVDKTEGIIAGYRNKNCWGERFIMESELNDMRSSARSAIKEFKKINDVVDDESLDRCIQTTQIAVYTYLYGLTLHIVMLETENSLDLIERYFKNQEGFIKEFRGNINELIDIMNTTVLNPSDAGKKLEEFSKKLEPFQERGRQLLESNKIAIAIVKTVLIVLVASLFAWGVGLLIGGLLALANVSATAAAVLTFTSQVVAFTVSSKFMEGVINGTSLFFDSVWDFVKECGTTALMFITFQIVGRIGQALFKAFGMSTSMLAVRFIAGWITIMVSTTPFFSWELYKNGKLSNGDEWIQFLIVQAISSAILSGFFTVIQNRMLMIETKVKTWGADTSRRWQEVRFNEQRQKIENEMRTAVNQWNEIDVKYREDFRPSLQTTQQMREAQLNLVKNAKKLLKAVKSLNKDLRLFRKNCPVEREYELDLSSQNEIEATEFLLTQATNRLKTAKYTADQTRALATTVRNALPGMGVDNAQNALLPLGKSTTYYQGMEIISKAEQIQNLNHS